MKGGMPLARQCALASVPRIPFTNKDVRTKDTIPASDRLSSLVD
jgi:hypothetical protein